MTRLPYLINYLEFNEIPLTGAHPGFVVKGVVSMRGKKQIQSLDLLINSCKENPLCDVISPVCPETYGKQGCFILT
jgi:hypothetical protein